MNTPKIKICTKCHLKKDASEFRDRLDKRDGSRYLNSECKTCEIERARIYYQSRKNIPSFKEKNRIRVREYRNKNIDEIKERRYTSEYRDKHLKWAMGRYYRKKEEINFKLKEKRKTPEYKSYVKLYRQKNKAVIYAQEVITKQRYHVKNRDALTDTYISHLLITQGIADKKTLSEHPELIKAKRLQLLIKRKIRQNGNTN